VELYGESVLPYNFHALQHLPRTAQIHGSIEDCSAFPYENYMQKLKKMVRHGHKSIQQVARHLEELKIHDRPSKTDAKQTEVVVRTNPPNNCFSLTDERFCLAKEVLKESKRVWCDIFTDSTDLFDDPCKLRLVGTHKVIRANVQSVVNSVATCLYSLVRVEDIGRGLNASVVSPSLVLAGMGKESSSGRCYVGGHHPLG